MEIKSYSKIYTKMQKAKTKQGNFGGEKKTMKIRMQSYYKQTAIRMIKCFSTAPQK